MKPAIYLFLSIAFFAVGFTETENFVSYLGKPLGAIFFGIFWIAYYLKEPVAQYDSEARWKIEHLPEKLRERAIAEGADDPDRAGTPFEGPLPNLTR